MQVNFIAQMILNTDMFIIRQMLKKDTKEKFIGAQRYCFE